MSEDKTQDMSQRYDTKPTFETIPEEVRSFRAGEEKRFDSLDIRLDRIESAVHETKSNFHTLRSDFSEGLAIPITFKSPNFWPVLFGASI